jgi:broad specificity phosphatase PhoE
MSEINIYFVRHAESCSNISIDSLGKISHPPLSYKGIQQAINLGINNEIINMDFDEYYSSPSLRTIMTACLSLRNKSCITPITLKLNSNLIEIQNKDSLLYDKQNSVVPKQNLKNMIDYIKLWFKRYYFNNYIDYEFIHIIYDLVLLLNHNNKLDIYKIEIIKLLDITKIDRKQILKELIDLLKLEQDIENVNKIGIINKANNNDINNIFNNILQFLETPEKFIIYHEQSNNKLIYEEIIKKLELFLNDYDFIKNIKIVYEYNDEDNHNANINIQQFIDNKIKLCEKSKNILCFSHGMTLKNFKNLNSSLKNTEILYYNVNNDFFKRIFNNNIIIDDKLIKDICGNLSFEYKMFKVINNYFEDVNYNNIEDINGGKHIYRPIYKLVKLNNI